MEKYIVKYREVLGSEEMLKLIHALDINVNSVIDYYESFLNKTEINCFAIGMLEISKKAYFDFVAKQEQNLYYLVEETNKEYVIGMGKLQNLDKSKNASELATGQIAYSVRPAERNKDYGTEILRLLLIKCEELGMKEVYVSCVKSNIASEKVILNNSGKKESEFFFSNQGYFVERFRINLHPKLTARILHLIK